MENKSKFLQIFSPAIITGSLIALFLSGKIIDIPQGTAKACFYNDYINSCY